MSRPRDKRRDEAFEIWKRSNGEKRLKDIAEELGVSASQIRKWKSQDNWEEKLNSNVTNSKNSNATKPGAPKGNKNARGNKGGKAPPGNQNAKGNPGGAAPKANKNAVTTGEYETIMWDYLDEEEQSLFNEVETDPLYMIDVSIRELSIRERRMMRRIAEVEAGLTDTQRKVLKQLRKSKEMVQASNKSGILVTAPVMNERLQIVQVEETEMRAIDDALSIEEALTRITDKKIKAIKQKHDMETAMIQQSLKLQQLQLSIRKTEVEIDRMAENNDDGPIEIMISRKGGR